jgi:hypothetical protein
MGREESVGVGGYSVARPASRGSRGGALMLVTQAMLPTLFSATASDLIRMPVSVS